MKRKRIRYERLYIWIFYQDQFTISNSAKTVRVITFHVPPEAGNMLQVLPKTGYVQAESSLTAQEGFLDPHFSLANLILILIGSGQHRFENPF